MKGALKAQPASIVRFTGETGCYVVLELFRRASLGALGSALHRHETLSPRALALCCIAANAASAPSQQPLLAAASRYCIGMHGEVDASL